MNKLHQTINQYLMGYANEQSVLDVSELHGFFSAIGSAPQAISIHQWMPAIWGGDEYMPEWTSEQHINEFVECVTYFYSQIMESFYLNNFTPLFNEKSTEEKIDTIADDWCFGYLRGLQLWNMLEIDDVSFLEDTLQAMRMFATDEGLEKLEQLSDEEINFWLVEIERSAKRIYQHFASQAMVANNKIVEGNKVSRNDPCPCGSGKKYKKCCLA